MKLLFVLTLFALLSTWVAGQDPACSVTSCTVDSDCPKFNSFDSIPTCNNGTCTSAAIVYIEIGEKCDLVSTTSRCREGLSCSAFGIGDGTTVCQTTQSYGCSCTTDDVCDGGLCLNGTCDALRSIGDPCTVDDHCGSICSNGVCATGPVGAKCNAHHSCSSGYCDGETCQTDTRAACNAANPFNGKCDNPTDFCYDGVCHIRYGGLGAECNATVPGPSCKVSLACINGACVTVAEGTPCSSSNDCNSLQSCVCGSGANSNVYGCYTTAGVECAAIFQELEDCLQQCTEPDAEGVPNTCANGCSSLRSQHECCISCANDSPIINYSGTCPDIQPMSCCSTTTACGTTFCGTSNNATSAPTTTPGTTGDSSSSTGSTTGVDQPGDEDGTSTGIGSRSSVPYLFLAGLLVLCSVILS